MTFEMTRIKQRLSDLEKGYKELSFWHDQWKKLHLEENNLDYKTIEKRLTDMYPELAP